MAERPRLDGQVLASRLAWLDETLGRLEQMPGPTAETALDAVAALTEVYGEALARVMDRAAADATLTGALADDRLLGHLLTLHDIHPRPAAVSAPGSAAFIPVEALVRRRATATGGTA